MARRATQSIERPIERSFHANGLDYQMFLIGECRDDGTWEGRIRFVPSDGEAVTTPIESTQPNERLLLDWARGLGSSFYDGAFRRAGEPRSAPPARKGAPNSTDVEISDVERRVLALLNRRGTVNRQVLFETIPEFSNADVERAIKSLEGNRTIIRFTDRGSVWVAPSTAGDGRQPRERRRTRAGGHPEVIYEHPHLLARDGQEYIAVVLGIERDDGTWGGWLQFRDAGSDRTIRTGQETSQPNRNALEYWASGVEDVYLEDALMRAMPESGNASASSRGDAPSVR
jgi:hypothetical protein